MSRISRFILPGRNFPPMIGASTRTLGLGASRLSPVSGALALPSSTSATMAGPNKPPPTESPRQRLRKATDRTWEDFKKIMVPQPETLPLTIFVLLICTTATIFMIWKLYELSLDTTDANAKMATTLMRKMAEEEEKEEKKKKRQQQGRQDEHGGGKDEAQTKGEEIGGEGRSSKEVVDEIEGDQKSYGPLDGPIPYAIATAGAKGPQ